MSVSKRKEPAPPKPRKPPKTLQPPFRNKSELRFAESLAAHGLPYAYEATRIRYTINREATYTPDFTFDRSPIVIEYKGRFDGPQGSKDRSKHLRIKEQHPALDIRFVFQKPHSPIYKGSKTTSAQWAEKHGFEWAHKDIPQEWVREIKRTTATKDTLQ